MRKRYEVRPGVYLLEGKMTKREELAFYAADPKVILRDRRPAAAGHEGGGDAGGEDEGPKADAEGSEGSTS